jgi:two-component system response regulator AtoC
MRRTSRTLHVLVIDDEPAIRQILAAQITDAGHLVSTAGDGKSALKCLLKGDIDVAFCDLRMPDINGIDVIKETTSAGIDTAFLVMTAFASVDSAIQAMRAGAYDYMLKPLRDDDVINRLENLGDVIGLRSENQVLRQIIHGQEQNQCTMASPAMRAIDNLIEKVAPTDSTVMITGPSGVGKGSIASSVHNQSPRSSGPFIPVNCGAIPESLLESEFFGHTKGAFTGADRAKRGLFVEADQGTIFLDEVGELPLNMQVKLLHVIEDQFVRAVGSSQSRKINVRIVAATNQDLEVMVREGTFREDLYFRLNVFRIEIPPLQQRPEDVSLLVDFFVEKESRKLRIQHSISIDAEARDQLCSYHWPGNIRELHNVISRALILAEDSTISPKDLSVEIGGADSLAQSIHLSGRGDLKEQMRTFEVAAISQAIETAGGDRKAAATRLGIGLSSLYRKLGEEPGKKNENPTTEETDND